MLPCVSGPSGIPAVSPAQMSDSRTGTSELRPMAATHRGNHTRRRDNQTLNPGLSPIKGGDGAEPGVHRAAVSGEGRGGQDQRKLGSRTAEELTAGSGAQGPRCGELEPGGGRDERAGSTPTDPGAERAGAGHGALRAADRAHGAAGGEGARAGAGGE